MHCSIPLVQDTQTDKEICNKISVHSYSRIVSTNTPYKVTSMQIGRFFLVYFKVFCFAFLMYMLGNNFMELAATLKYYVARWILQKKSFLFWLNDA